MGIASFLGLRHLDAAPSAEKPADAEVVGRGLSLSLVKKMCSEYGYSFEIALGDEGQVLRFTRLPPRDTPTDGDVW